MKKSDSPGPFPTPEERRKAILALEAEIQRLMEDIDRAYSRLGRSLHTMTEQETPGINEMTDKVVALKQKLRKLRQKGPAKPE